MSYSQKNSNGNDERSNHLNQNNIWGVDSSHINSLCQSCNISVARKNDLCGHILCDACCEKSMCSICKPTSEYPFGFGISENFARRSHTLSNGRNEFNGFNVPYEGKREEIERQPHNKASPQSRYNFLENKEESHRLTVPSPQFLSSSSFYRTSQVSRMSNQSQEYSASPSPPSNDLNDGFNKANLAQSAAFPPLFDFQNSESQQYLSHNGLHHQKDHIGYDNFPPLALCDQYPYISSSSNLPTHSSKFSPRQITNNDFQAPNISNNDERKVQEMLKDVVINTCSHEKNELFCHTCLQYLCMKCREHHKDHPVCFKSDALKFYEDCDQLLEQSFFEIENNIKDGIRKIKAEKTKLNQNYDSCLEQINSHCDDVRKEISVRGAILKNNVDAIADSKISLIESQIRHLNGRGDNIIPRETASIYFNRENEYACASVIKEFGSVYGSSSIEKTLVSGIALSKIIINHPCGFIVQCYDDLGNKCFSGGEDIKATLIGPNKETCHVEIRDLQNGLYQGIVSTQVEGNHKLAITLRGNTIFENEYVLKSKYYVDLRTIFTNMYSKLVLEQISDYFYKEMHCDENGRLFVTDSKSHCIHIFDHELKNLNSFGGPGEADGEFQNPHGITVDKEKRIIVADSDNHRIQVFSYDGEFKFKFGSVGSEKSHFKFPEGVATDSEGNIAVADRGNNRIQLFDKFGNFITVTKSHSNSRPIESPNGICFDGDNKLFVTRSGSNNMPVVKFRLIRNSCEVRFERDYEPVYLPEFQAKNPLGLIKKNDCYILSCSPIMRDNRESSLYFYNARTNERRVLLFHDKTPYGVAVSPEGSLYVSFLSRNNSMSELYVYEPPKYG